MAGIPVACAHAWHDADPVLIRDRPEGIEAGHGIGLGIDRGHLGRPRAVLRRFSAATSDSWMLPASGSM